ncbi:hypothetical protein [uncultured Rhodoblastus sp.]|uniref:hypothetical protein n=1 Tax=uncultured Rhodoblastus sp. TaxID=543037 RepID=UPI0025FE2C18|nr:hypothetical protein [uncultured Rhodoblastus sp.]
MNRIFESRLKALEAAKSVTSGPPKIPPELRAILDELAAHAGRTGAESQASAVARAMGMDSRTMRDLIKRDHFQFWTRVLDTAARTGRIGH